ncbi:hypothetical protein BB560_003746, partial [Smittium megazygosporum]
GITYFSYGRTLQQELGKSPKNMDELNSSIIEKREHNFEVLQGSGGKKGSKHVKKNADKLVVLTDYEVDAIFARNENASCIRAEPARTGGGSGEIPYGQVKWYSNQIPSNSPIEDYISYKRVEHNKHFFGVFDGHAGYRCAETISSELPNLLSDSYEVIEQVLNNGFETKKGANKTQEDRIKEMVSVFSDSNKKSLRENKDSIALTSTYILMDEKLVKDNLHKFMGLYKSELNGNENSMSLEKQTEMLKDADNLLGPAVSGSCAIGLVLDAEAGKLTVANTGDSRAIIGRYNEGSGTYKAIPLSEDQTANGNRKEYERMIREHPSESSTVIMRGRVLGGLMPTRAFGDSRYKWPIEVQNMLFPMLYQNGHRYATSPRNYFTPPYVTARPTLVVHELIPSDKFIVIATDGLFDRLENSEIVEFVEGEEGEGNVASKVIKFSLSRDDSNVKKLLANKDQKLANLLLSIPSPFSRSLRDDISVYVIVL